MRYTDDRIGLSNVGFLVSIRSNFECKFEILGIIRNFYGKQMLHIIGRFQSVASNPNFLLFSFSRRQFCVFILFFFSYFLTINISRKIANPELIYAAATRQRCLRLTRVVRSTSHNLERALLPIVDVGTISKQ